MAWGQPKRNSRNACGHRGQCSCQRRINNDAAARPESRSHPCPLTGCGLHKDRNKTCGRTVRNGTCPCPYC